MLRQEQNEFLTRTAQGTPMGEMFRRYWIPALLAEELPENDCPPVRVQLLSERLIAFRDTEGPLGLIDEFCAHRGVSLWFGRNEECGLRCPYHGWKYDVTGQCVELPSEPESKAASAPKSNCVLSVDRARRRAVDLHGSARPSTWAARIRIRLGAAAQSLRLQKDCNTATGCRRWRAASIPATCPGCIATRCAPIR
jgi:nitrite reductase/ring-hydroxylating ferredoxin subunit